MEFLGQLIGFSIFGWFFYSFIIKPIYLEKDSSDEEKDSSDEAKKWVFIIWILPPIITILFIIFY
jgi:hypothetical protein